MWLLCLWLFLTELLVKPLLNQGEISIHPSLQASTPPPCCNTLLEPSRFLRETSLLWLKNVHWERPEYFSHNLVVWSLGNTAVDGFMLPKCTCYLMMWASEGLLFPIVHCILRMVIAKKTFLFICSLFAVTLLCMSSLTVILLLFYILHSLKTSHLHILWTLRGLFSPWYMRASPISVDRN